MAALAHGHQHTRYPPHGRLNRGPNQPPTSCHQGGGGWQGHLQLVSYLSAVPTIVNNFFNKPLDKTPKVWYIIVVREGISKALLLTDATSTNGEETLERKRRLQVALQFNL